MKTKGFFVILIVALLFTITINAQERTITGTISANNNPVVGATITVKDTQVSTVSDNQGNYSITVPEGNTILIFSAPVHKTKLVNLASSNVINIKMQVLTSLYEKSIEDLLNIKVTIASKKAMTQRESPGIVSVITEEEIQNSGASDLQDVLRLVPGFEFLMDVTAATGISLRGNMGYIGRVLIMMDGQELNELFYACTFTGNHYPVSIIKRIEIIRGPGSSIYGGFAELGVINIITKSGSNINGIDANVDYGQMSKTFSHKNITMSAGKKINDFEFALHAHYGKGNRSERDFTYIDGRTFNMAGQSDIDPMLFNTSIKFKELSTNIIYDKYITESKDYYGTYMAGAYNIDYESILGEIKYEWKISDKLTLTPKFNFVSNTPWHSVEPPVAEDKDSKLDFDKSASRTKFNLLCKYNLSDSIDIITGVEYYHDNATHKLGFTNHSFWNGNNKVAYNNISGFAQVIIKTNIAIMTIGARVDKHNQYGPSFAPRICFTKSFNKFHMKLLYSRAYRTPSIDEIDLNYYLPPSKPEPNLKPEKAAVTEFEAGYRITQDMSFNANIFYGKIRNSIVFSYSEEGWEGGEGYDNRGTSGTKGIELEYRFRQQWGYLTLNYSYYNSKDITEIDYYKAIGHEGVLLGTSPHKITLNSSFHIYKGLSVNPSFIYLGERYGYTLYDETTEEMPLSKFNPLLMPNLFFNYTNAFIYGLNLGIGAYNITNAEYNIIQAYNGWHPPLPERGRRIILKLSYNFDFNSNK